MTTTQRMKSVYQAVGKLLLVIGLTIGQGRADTLTWIGGTNAWHEVAHWSNLTESGEARVPAAGDTVVVTQAYARVILSDSSADLAALIISNATVSCENWETVLSATNVTIQSGGTLTCEGPFVDGAMSNRVNVVAESMFVATNGSVDVDGRGYSGGFGSLYAAGNGPGSNPSPISTGDFIGASHGGAGRFGASRDGTPIALTNGYSFLTDNTYGSAEAPILPGSGGSGGLRSRPN